MKLRDHLAGMLAVAGACVLFPVGGLYFIGVEIAELREAATDARVELGTKLELTALVEGYFREQRDRSIGFTGEADSASEAESRRRVLDTIARTQYSGGEQVEKDEDEASETQSLETVKREFIALADETLRLGRFEPSRAAEFEALYDRRFQRELLPRLFDTIAEEQAELTEALAELDEEATRAGWLGAASLLLGALGLFVMARWIAGRAQHSLTRLIEGTRELAKGGLQARIPELPIDELEEIGHAFNRMAASLEESLDAKVRVEKLAAVGQLAASVSHEIRNPLSAARNALAYLRRRQAQTPLAGDKRFAEFIELADRELGACNRIVTDLLDYARERPLELTACLLAPLCKEVLDVVQRRPDVEVDISLGAEVPPIDADRDQLRQILLNLVQNGIEAIPLDRPGRVCVLARAESDRVALSVRDDGTGIPEADRSRIFEPLVTTKTKGTGLGLAITRSIIARHGWRLRLDTEVGKGTTFHIDIPLLARQAAE